MLDPTIVVAIINATGGIFSKVIIYATGGIVAKLITLAGKSEPNDKAKRTVEKAYDKIASAVTTNSVRVLIKLREAGSKQSPGMLRAQVEPMRQ